MVYIICSTKKYNIKRNITNLIFLVLLLLGYGCNRNKEKLYIKGCWSQNKNDNVELIFNQTNVEYFGTEYLYEYKIDDNSLLIMESGKIVLKYKIIKLSQDSLILKSTDNEIYEYFKLKGICNGNLITL
jgi:hypothetical protein